VSDTKGYRLAVGGKNDCRRSGGEVTGELAGLCF
jgi:hypothetical protein